MALHIEALALRYHCLPHEVIAAPRWLPTHVALVDMGRAALADQAKREAS